MLAILQLSARLCPSVDLSRYMHLKQDLHGPKGDEAPEAEVNWIKCSKDTLA